MKISLKIPLLFVLFSLVAAGATAAFSYYSARTTLIVEAENRLITALDTRREQVSTWLEMIETDLITHAMSPGVQLAVERFSMSFSMLKGNKTEFLQDQYIRQNPNPTGKKELLDYGSDEVFYNEVHKEYHPYFRTVQQDRGYYDIFLFDDAGSLIYSVFKEADYATNVLTGRWAKTDLGAAYRAAIASTEGGDLNFFDFKPYAPSNDAPAAFISSVVFDAEGKKIGVIAFQMPIDRLNAMMQRSVGLGETGETYLVGPDSLMRSNSRFSTASDFMKTLNDTEATAKALKGQRGIMTKLNRQGDPVLAAYEPLEFMGVTWALIAEQESHEVVASAIRLRNQLIVELLVLTVLIGIIGLLIGRSISNPLTSFREAMAKVAEGDYQAEVPGAERRDEIGAISKRLLEFRETLSKGEIDREEAARSRARMEADQAHVVESLSIGLKELAAGTLTARIHEPFTAEYEQLRHDFNGAMEKVQDALHAVVMTSTGIRNSAAEVSQAADDLSRRTENQAATLEETAAALEEMTASVKSASEGAEKANRYVITAKGNAEESGNVVRQTVQAMGEIEHSSSQISQIIGVIGDIAFQTNLLALNAGVEAARAGDAGRGFAVVASEVRALAQRSSDAAKEIKELISASSGHVERGVDLVGKTGTALGEIVEMVANISVLVSEINGASKEQATGLDEINSAVTQLDQVTQQNAAMVEESTAASHELTRDAEELNRLTARFSIGDAGGATGEAARPSQNAPSAANRPAPERRPSYATTSHGSAAVKLEPAGAIDQWEDF